MFTKIKYALLCLAVVAIPFLTVALLTYQMDSEYTVSTARVVDCSYKINYIVGGSKVSTVKLANEYCEDTFVLKGRDAKKYKKGELVDVNVVIKRDPSTGEITDYHFVNLDL